MKNFNRILIAITTLFTTTAFAQKVTHNDTFSSTIEKTTSVYKNGEIQPINLKMKETRSYGMRFKDADAGKVDKDIILEPAYVTKKIYVDNDQDQFYDKFIVINYEQHLGDTFEVIPTENSIAVKIAPDMLIPIKSEGFVVADNDDADVIMVEEFTEM